MNDDDLAGRLSGALHELGDRPAPPSALDPARLRRRGDARRARRQAAGASLASAMVFVIAIGTVYYAAHKSRTRVVAGADIKPYVVSASPRSPRPTYLAPLTITGPRTVLAVAGVPTTVSYELDSDGRALVTRTEYGDGVVDGHCPAQASGERPTAPPASVLPSEQRLGSFTHTWTVPGSYSYTVSADYACGTADPLGTLTGTVIVRAAEAPTPAPTGVTITDQPPSAGLGSPQPRVPGSTFQPAVP